MLIEFSVENFRSIRHRQTLSMVAAPRLQKKYNTIKTKLKGEVFPSLLKATAIYGPNASGKSNLIKALGVISEIARSRPSSEKTKLQVAPFKFDADLQDKPSIFELHFIENETRYSLVIELTVDRIFKEELTQYVTGLPRVLYSRSYVDGRDEYFFGDFLEGGPVLHEAWRQLTGPQIFFISQAVANSNEELKQLRIPFSWIRGLMIEDSGMRGMLDIAQMLISNTPKLGSEIAKILNDVDIPISSIRVDVSSEKKKDLSQLPEFLSESDSANERMRKYYSAERVTTTLTHKTSLGEFDFDLRDESEGTRNLLGFSVPWFIFRFNGGEARNKILIVDEIDSSLHPKLVEALVKMHLFGDIDCQLIFTTHDTHLMDTKLLRRDQLWLTERDEAGATQLRSVHDFEGRESEDVEKRYYEGRYRGLPFIKGV